MREYFKDLVAIGGTPSSGRFAFLFSILFSNVILWYTWLLICIYTRTLVDIPEGVYTAYGIANGTAFFGKGMQSFAERRPSSESHCSNDNGENDSKRGG